MNCRQAQREIALLAGDDLSDDDRRRDVERHLAVCPACREKQARMGAALGAMVAAEAPATYDCVHSLWPGVRRQLSRPASRASAGSDWKSWTPFAAGVVTCAGLLVAASATFRDSKMPAEPVTREISPLYPRLRPAIDQLDEESNAPAGVRPVVNRSPLRD
jgi:hypothetical protein